MPVVTLGKQTGTSGAGCSEQRQNRPSPPGLPSPKLSESYESQLSHLDIEIDILAF